MPPFPLHPVAFAVIHLNSGLHHGESHCSESAKLGCNHSTSPFKMVGEYRAVVVRAFNLSLSQTTTTAITTNHEESLTQTSLFPNDPKDLIVYVFIKRHQLQCICMVLPT